MSKAADLANLIGNINAGGGGVNRNLIINGSMNVAQRGTVTGVANNAYTLDRFAFTYAQDGAFTVTQDSSAPDGFANSLKLDVTTADSSLAASQYLIMEHKIEAQNLQHLHFGKSSAKNIALSFYVKSNKTGTYGVSIIQSDNSSKIANLTYTINSADTWEQKSLTFTGDTSGVINDDNGIGLKLGFTLAVGSTWTSGDTSASFRTFVNGNYGAGQTVNILDHVDNEWFITGVQLEVGQNPTEFEHEPIERTLAKCQRYYIEKEIHQIYRELPSNTAEYMAEDFPVFMRAQGTGIIKNQVQYWSSGTPTNITPGIYPRVDQIRVVVGGLTNSRGFVSGGIIASDAEL